MTKIARNPCVPKWPAHAFENGPLVLCNIGRAFLNARRLRGQSLLSALIRLGWAPHTGGTTFSDLCRKSFYQRKRVFEPMKLEKGTDVEHYNACICIYIHIIMYIYIYICML